MKHIRNQEKRERVPNYACVHRDDRSFVVIASSWQTARLTLSDAQRPTPLPLLPPLLCMAYFVCRVVWYMSCIIPQRRGTSIQSVVSGLLDQRRKKIIVLDSLEKKNPRGKKSLRNVDYVGLLINPLQRFSVTAAVPMPLPLVQFVTTIWPDPHLNPPFVKWCDLQFFSKVGSCSRVINSQYVFLIPFVLRCRSSFVVLEPVGTPGDIVTIPLKRTRLWLKRVTTGNFRNRFGWCYNALQPVVMGFGFFRHSSGHDLNLESTSE